MSLQGELATPSAPKRQRNSQQMQWALTSNKVISVLFLVNDGGFYGAVNCVCS